MSCLDHFGILEELQFQNLHSENRAKDCPEGISALNESLNRYFVIIFGFQMGEHPISHNGASNC